MGPAEVFSQPTVVAPGGRRGPCYQIVTMGISKGACTTDSGITIKPHVPIQNAPILDTVIIPGGEIHNPKVNREIVHWLGMAAPAVRRIAALGSGIYALAATGLIDERQVLTHSRLGDDLASRFPKLHVSSTGLFLKDGPFYTCAGEIAAIDLSLALVEEDYGRQVALAVARDLVIQVKRSGDEDQYSQLLRFQIQSSDRFADLPAWIFSHLSDDLSVEVLARKSCMSLRNFTRLFSREFGKSPAEFVAEARMAEARRRVLLARNNLENIAVSLGYKSTEVFSKAFERNVGIRPSRFRHRQKLSPAKLWQKQSPARRVAA